MLLTCPRMGVTYSTTKRVACCEISSATFRVSGGGTEDPTWPAMREYKHAYSANMCVTASWSSVSPNRARYADQSYLKPGLILSTSSSSSAS